MPKRFLLIAVTFWTTPALAQMQIEYVAHACFMIESPQGQRVVIDPYNGHTWLGYGFPDDLTADAVLITHPHYDHDASYYFDAETPVFRKPGRYQLGDITIIGVPGEHAGAERFRARGAIPYNTIWVVEIDGLRLAHLGDNGALTPENLTQLGQIDILIARATGTYDDLVPAMERLGVSVLVPNHYRLPDVSDMPKRLKSVDEWLDGVTNIERHHNRRSSYTRASLPGETQVQVLPHSTGLVEWSAKLHRAWSETDAATEARETDRPQSIRHLRAAVELAPLVMKFHWLLADALAESSRDQEAIDVLVSGLSQAGNDDWTDRMRARALLAKLYLRNGEPEHAAAQYRIVARHPQTYAAQELSSAQTFLSR